MLFIYLFLLFSMCRLGFFAIFFTEMCTATLQQWELEPTAPKAAVFWARGGGGAAWKPAKLVLAGKLEEQGDRAVSAALCYHVLTGTRARIWVKLRI